MSFNSEFQLHKFGFGDEDMKQIYLLEEWVIPLAFRFAAAVYFIIGIILSIVNFPTPKWLLYLSYWNEILFTSYFIVGAILTAYLVSKRNESNKTNIPSYGAIALENENDQDSNTTGDTVEEGGTPSTANKPRSGIEKILGVISWMLMNTTTVLSFIIILIYWPIFVEAVKKYPPQEKFTAYNVHGINFIVLLIDFFLHRIPVRIMHFIYPFTVGVLYIILSLVYSLATHKAMYGILDWYYSPGKSAAIGMGVLVGVVLVQMMLYGLHRLKLMCFK